MHHSTFLEIRCAIEFFPVVPHCLIGTYAVQKGYWHVAKKLENGPQVVRFSILSMTNLGQLQ